VSAGQTPGYPPPPPPGGTAPPPAPPPSKRGLFDQFKGLQWWEVFLSVLPLGLVVVGGLIGAVIGLLGMLANLNVARRVQSVGVRALVMVSVVLVCLVVWIIVAGLLFAMTHPSA
jgi:hypothetical protein